jgi:hypothetical protein
VSYEFDRVVLWRGHNTFWWQHDSGCSCPVPFEKFKGLPDLCSGSNFADLEAFLRDIESYHQWPLTRVLDFLSQARKAMTP